MFDNLSEKLGGILDRLTRRGALTTLKVEDVRKNNVHSSFSVTKADINYNDILYPKKK